VGKHIKRAGYKMCTKLIFALGKITPNPSLYIKKSNVTSALHQLQQVHGNANRGAT
jgi:hypothetical protein